MGEGKKQQDKEIRSTREWGTGHSFKQGGQGRLTDKVTLAQRLEESKNVAMKENIPEGATIAKTLR